MKQERRESSRYHPGEQQNFAARLGRGIREYSPTIVIGSLIGMGIGGFIYGGAALDQSLNTQLVELMRVHTEWYQYLTTKHALTPVILDHPREIIGATAATGALAGGAIARFLSW